MSAAVRACGWMRRLLAPEEPGCERTVSASTAIAYNRNRRDARIEESGRRRATVRSGAAMTWEWEHRNNRGQWTLTVGAWHAVVQPVAPSRPLWHATPARTIA